VSLPLQTFLTLCVGFVTGVLSGMFGVGGAVVSTPAIRALGATAFESVASTLPSIFPSAVSGSIRYGREGLISSRIVVWVSFAGIFAAVGGALLVGVVPGEGHVLMIVTAGLIAFTAFRMGRPAPREPELAPTELVDPVGDLVEPVDGFASRDDGVAVRAEWWRLAIIGIAAGGLSGLLGLGGGLILVPAFAAWVRLGLKQSLGTSLACVGVLAIPSTITHTLLGNIDWAFAIPLSIGVIPGAQLGAHLAIRSSDRTLRRLVATVLGLIAIVYATTEIVALVR
jgi:uncharacterized membrane protein YfcA